jgi:hypothetical protein
MRRGKEQKKKKSRKGKKKKKQDEKERKSGASSVAHTCRGDTASPKNSFSRSGSARVIMAGRRSMNWRWWSSLQDKYQIRDKATITHQTNNRKKSFN